MTFQDFTAALNTAYQTYAANDATKPAAPAPAPVVTAGLPKWALPVGALVAVLLVVLLMRRK